MSSGHRPGPTVVAAEGQAICAPPPPPPAMGELSKAHPLVSPASARPLRCPPPAPSRKASRIGLAPFRYGRGTNLYSLIPKGEAKPPPLTTPSCFNALPQERLSTNRGPRGSWCPVGTVQDRRSWLLRGKLSAPRLRLACQCATSQVPTPYPPPVNVLSGNRQLIGTGGGFNSIISFQRGPDGPLCEPPTFYCLLPQKPLPAVGAKGVLVPAGHLCPLGGGKLPPPMGKLY